MTHPIHWTRPQPAKDLTGKTFGIITVVRSAPSTGSGSRWRVRYDCCGEERVLSRGDVIRGVKTHRGCQRETT